MHFVRDTFGMVLEMPEPMFCILQGISAFRSEKGFWVHGPHFVDGPAFCKPLVLFLWKAPAFVSP